VDHQDSSQAFMQNSPEKMESSSAKPDVNLEGSPILPDSYGDNRLVILPRDPYWFFAYWEVTPERAGALRAEYGPELWDSATLVLRVYDSTASADGSGPYFDVDIPDRWARQWYVQVPASGRAYVVDLGLRLPDGRFILLLKSNRITLPLGHISDLTDNSWMTFGSPVQQQAWEVAALRPDALQGGSGKGSAEFARSMAQRWEFLKTVFSGASSRLSSRGSPPVSPAPVPEKKP